MRKNKKWKEGRQATLVPEQRRTQWKWRCGSSRTRSLHAVEVAWLWPWSRAELEHCLSEYESRPWLSKGKSANNSDLSALRHLRSGHRLADTTSLWLTWFYYKKYYILFFPKLRQRGEKLFGSKGHLPNKVFTFCGFESIITYNIFNLGMSHFIKTLKINLCTYIDSFFKEKSQAG